MAQLVPLRPIKIVWDDRVDGECEWCGANTASTWVIWAAPMDHEFFCSPDCVAEDTGLCWEPSKEMYDSIET